MFYMALALVFLQSAPVPNELKSWVPWVTHGVEHMDCPISYNDGGAHFCLMTGPLTLDVNEQGGNFVLNVTAYHQTKLFLPNSEKVWPQTFQVNNRPFPIAEIKGAPYVILEKGTWNLRGTFAWDSLPHTLSISPIIPSVELTLNGKKVLKPNRKKMDKLWLSEPQNEKESEDRVFMNVFRLWRDGNPVKLTTEIQLSVSGKVQNWHLPVPMPAAFHLTKVDSPIPFQQEGDQLNFQLRPGQWVVTLEGLSSEHILEASWPEMNPPWPEQEILSFVSSPSIRQVEITGLQSMDPSQLPIPESWTSYPCYLLENELVFEERMRGASVSNIPDVTLYRELWLDYDGKGYSISDSIEGQLPKATFFTLNEPYKMGTAKEGGENVLITLDQEGRSGVEIRNRSFQLNAESRVDSSTSKLPATGWNTAIKNTNGTLNLPPGWILFHAGGPIEFHDTWLQQWNLFDFFILLLLCFTFSKLWSRNTGILAAACLFLCYQESDIPPFFWICLAVLTALVVYLPDGKMRAFTGWLRYLNLLVLVFLIFAFSASHLRTSIYPHLERPSYVGVGMTLPEATLNMDDDWEIGIPDAPAESKREVMSEMVQQSVVPLKKMRKYTPNEAVQTGYGLPSWPRGSGVSFSSSSPIDATQNMKLWLISPGMKFVLTILQIALLILLLKKIWTTPKRKFGLEIPPAASAFVILLAVFLGSPVQAQFPSQELLDQLKERVLEKPDCLPHCAQYQNLELEIADNTLDIILTIHAHESVAVPLPGSFTEWAAQNVTKNSRNVPLFLSADGHLWVSVEKGLNRFDMSGDLPPGSSFSISFPLKVHNLNIQAKGWTFETPESAENKSFIRFYRTNTDEDTSDVQTEDHLSPFFLVHRKVKLDQKWTAQTVVSRLGESNLSLLLEIPLLTGEAVTTKGIQVKDEVAFIQFPGHLKRIAWESALLLQDKMTLQASPKTWLAEKWTLKPSQLWHIDYEGIEPVTFFDSDGEWSPSWSPWPGESITITSVKPNASPGKTSTIDSVTLNVSPGKSLSESSMKIQLNTSKGMTKTLDLPSGVRVKTVKVDSRPIPFKPDQNQIEIPLNPGRHDLEITWEESKSLGMVHTSPKIDLGEPSLNNQVSVNMPYNRWIFLVSGPSQGPVLLFWSHVLFFLLSSFFLAKIPWIPLKFHQWFLLSLGLDQVHIGVAFFVYFWIIVLAYKGHKDTSTKPWRHNLAQICLAGLTFIAAMLFLESIRQGLLSSPEMGITGNGSYGKYFKWYLERPDLPITRIFSLPLWIYRFAMLFWAIWLARLLTEKAIWAWDCFQKGSIWRKGNFKLRQPTRRRPSKSEAIKTES